jgi:hypothetical protein
VPKLTPEQRSMRARLAAHARWKREDPTETARKGQRGLLARFEREVDPEGQLPEAERQRRAKQALKEHMTRLAFASSRARAKAGDVA